jgi:post-segregation antitoxin (ccd killing protein)
MIHDRSTATKVRATIYLPADILEEARNATVHLAGYPARMTLTKLAEDALRAELRRLKDRYNDGQDFPSRADDLKGGRPIAA